MCIQNHIVKCSQINTRNSMLFWRSLLYIRDVINKENMLTPFAQYDNMQTFTPVFSAPVYFKPD